MIASRYNLKRRVASLPPISVESFAEKVLTAQASSTAEAARTSFERLCPACQKTYYSENAYENHLKSQKHRLRVSVVNKDALSTEDGETASVISSTISLGQPINATIQSESIAKSPPSDSIDAEAEEEFSKVVNSIKEAVISKEPVSRRPTRPHHSADEQRKEHPLSPEKSRSNIDHSMVDSAPSSPEENLSFCLFCNFNSISLSQNMKHMAKTHGLFIPERDFLIDLKGLLKWLYERIHSKPHECLYCHKSKNTAEAIQGHMRDSGHCRIAFEEETDMIEVGQFYDFRSTYSDEETEKDDDQTSAEEVDEDGWEDDSSVESEDVDQEFEINGSSKPKKPRSRSRTHSRSQALIFDDELYLPSGRVAGHRSLARYYRQNLHNHPSELELLQHRRHLEAAQEQGDGDVPITDDGLLESRRREDGRGRQMVSRANGGLGMLGVTEAKRREVQAVEKRDTRRAQRAEKQYQWAVNERRNNQKHFRDPLLQ